MSLSIILMILGVCAFIAGFVIPEKKRNLDKEDLKLGEEKIKELAENQVKEVREKISDMVDETITYAVEKTERSMERLTNEKIMAVNEYADTVLESIHKNHEEVVFLYDMLSDKHKNLTDTAAEVDKKTKEVRESVEETAKAAKESAEVARKSAEVAREAKTAAEESKRFSPLRKIGFESVDPSSQVIETVNEADYFAVFDAEEAEASQPQKKAPAKRIAKSAKKTDDKKRGGAKADDAKQDTAAPETKADDEKRDSEKNVKGQKRTGKTVAAGRTKAEEREEVGLSFASKKVGAQNNNEQILSLHKEGKSNMAIAKQLGLGIGEVKLVIDLFEGM